jgi:creatinine amidohydrolase
LAGPSRTAPIWCSALALRIAEALGDALVAPVLAYVPEGRIDPPSAHMRWAGTISVPEPAFESLLDGAALSLCRHGFRDVVLLGDHGGYQAALQRVAARHRAPGCRVTALGAYYGAAQSDFPAWLSTQGYGSAEIGIHAGLADTALSLAIDPTLVRAEAQARGASDGVSGDPRRATAELGRHGVALIVERSVQAIRALRSVR